MLIFQGVTHIFRPFQTCIFHGFLGPMAAGWGISMDPQKMNQDFMECRCPWYLANGLEPKVPKDRPFPTQRKRIILQALEFSGMNFRSCMCMLNFAVLINHRFPLRKPY